MRKKAVVILLMAVACGVFGESFSRRLEAPVLSYVVDPQKQDLRFFYTDDNGQRFATLLRLKDWCARRQEKLVFAMNGGMFDPGHVPVGLYMQEGRVIKPIDTSAGTGNFYLRPNGVFYLTKDHRAIICPTAAFRDSGQVAYATQSGPMLLIDGAVHPAFTQGSANRNIRNGVGVLPGNRILFAISKEPVNFYDFAAWFKAQGCREALYLDGFVSRAYLPAKGWEQIDGDLGFLIGVTEKSGRDPAGQRF